MKLLNRIIKILPPWPCGRSAILTIRRTVLTHITNRPSTIYDRRRFAAQTTAAESTDCIISRQQQQQPPRHAAACRKPPNQRRLKSLIIMNPCTRQAGTDERRRRAQTCRPCCNGTVAAMHIHRDRVSSGTVGDADRRIRRITYVHHMGAVQ